MSVHLLRLRQRIEIYARDAVNGTNQVHRDWCKERLTAIAAMDYPGDSEMTELTELAAEKLLEISGG